ncbi:MAG: AMP-binding protein, partial [Verrucomicrobiia bacterium]
FFGALWATGWFGGMFLVPVSAVLVGWSPPERKGEILAGANLLSSVAAVVAVGVQAWASQVMGWDWRGQLVMLAVLALGAGVYLVRLLPDELLRLTALGWARLHYRVRVLGREQVPTEGGALVVCNHVSYVDVVCLSVACPRPIRFLADEQLFRVPLLGAVLRIFGAVPVSPLRAKEALARAAEAIRSGELVCIFPEGMLTRTGLLMELKGGFELIARRAGCPVLVAHVDGLWGSIFSFAGGRYFFKWPERWRRSVTVSFAAVLRADEATVERVRVCLLDLGEAAFREREGWKVGLGARVARGLGRAPWRVAVVDRLGGRRVLRRGEVLAAGWALARRWRGVPGKRIGIVLPPGAAGVLANVSVLWAGKVPVNLNPTVGPEAFGSACRQAGLEVVVTAERVRRKFAGLPWPEGTVDLGTELKRVGRWQLGWRWVLTWLVPSGWLAGWVAGGEVEADREAVLLFTSGSSGKPKGVPLTHRNVVGNLAQIAETSAFEAGDVLLGSLPLFHSFGLTVGLWHPLVTGTRLVTVVSPLEAGMVGDAVAEEGVTVVATTPTFLRSYVKRWKSGQARTVRLLLTGAERLPLALAMEVEREWGVVPQEGYGLTETSPAVALNLRDPGQGLGARTPQTGGKRGTVGRLLPGMSFRLFDPETGAVSRGQGLLGLRGVNVFGGYLDRPEATEAVFREGWFVTGDVVRMDREGFVTIVGRLSRFSKIGGEMVPHGTVEEALWRALPPKEGGGGYVIVGVPDEAKGEQLVLVTDGEVEVARVREALEGAGLPTLWIPRRVVKVERIPLLASGKVDLGGCRRLVEAAGVD